MGTALHEVLTVFPHPQTLAISSFAWGARGGCHSRGQARGHRESSSPVTEVSHPFSNVLQVCLPALPHRPCQCQHSLERAKYRGDWRSRNRHHTM